MRYLYERIPELPVIAAGSLLDFAIEQIGIPVGRVESLYVYPMSFLEFLLSTDGEILVQEILSHPASEPLSEPVHNKLLSLLGEYIAIGGMPGVVQSWAATKDPARCFALHHALLDTYRQDFVKYAKKNQIKYVDLVFKSIPQQLGQKFKYSLIEGEYRKRELSPALDLLVTAGVAKKVYYSAGQGTPLGAQSSDLDYRVIFLDVGLAQAQLNFDVTQWFLKPEQEFINKGSLIEAFVGQELAAYAPPYMKSNLYYWHKDSAPTQAEIDYLAVIDFKVVPIAASVVAGSKKNNINKAKTLQEIAPEINKMRSREVKSGSGRTLKSLHYFLKTHKQSPYGIKFTTQDYSVFTDKDDDFIIYSYPLYAIAKVIACPPGQSARGSDHNHDMLAAMQALIE